MKSVSEISKSKFLKIGFFYFLNSLVKVYDPITLVCHPGSSTTDNYS